MTASSRSTFNIVQPDTDSFLIHEPNELHFRHKEETLTVSNVHQRPLVFYLQYRTCVQSKYRVTPACGILSAQSCIRALVTKVKAETEPKGDEDDNFRLLYAFIEPDDVESPPMDVWKSKGGDAIYLKELRVTLAFDQDFPDPAGGDREGRPSTSNSSTSPGTPVSRGRQMGSGGTISSDVILPGILSRALSSQPGSNDPNEWLQYFKTSQGGSHYFRFLPHPTLRSGGFCFVSKGELLLPDQSKKLIAIKELKPVDIDAASDVDAYFRLKQRFENEAHPRHSLEHPNVAPLLAFTFQDVLRLISPWYELGDVGEYTCSQPHGTRLRLMRDSAKGLKYMHDEHRPWGHQVLKRSPGIEAAESHNIKSFHEGNVLWLAPELLKGQPAERSPRSKETDVFAFGCLLLEIATGELPFKSRADGIARCSVPELVSSGKRSNPDDYPELVGRDSDFWRLLDDCWEQKPDARPKMATILEKLESLSGAEVWKQQGCESLDKDAIVVA